MMSSVDAEPKAGKSKPWLPAKWDYEADVVVVGYGGAGVCAAVVAHDAGAQVLILEKAPFAGGNTGCSRGGLRPHQGVRRNQILPGFDCRAPSTKNRSARLPKPWSRFPKDLRNGALNSSVSRWHPSSPHCRDPNVSISA